MQESITITYSTENPIPLETFADSLFALEKEYKSISNNTEKLMVKEIRKGSFEIELIAVAIGTSLIPIMSNFNTIGKFFEYMKMSATWLLGRSEKPKEIKYSITELTELKKIFEPIVICNDPQSSMRIISPTNEQYELSKKEVEQISENLTVQSALAVLSDTDIPTETTLKKVLFYWYQTRFDTGKINIGNKGVINKIDNVPRKIIFENDASSTKKEMTTTNAQFGVDWQKVGYIVDAELILKDNKIIAYKILHNYINDAIYGDDYDQISFEVEM